MSTRTGIRISALQEDLDELTRVDISSDSTTATISTEGTKDLILNTNEGTNSGSITIKDGTGGDILLEPKNNVVVDKDTGDAVIRVQAGSASDTDGAAQVTFTDWQRTASIGLMSTDIIIAKDSSIDPLSDDRRVTINVDSGNVGIGHKFGQHRQPDGSASASVLNVENTTTSGSAQGGNLRLGSNDGAAMGSGHRIGVVEFAGSEAASPGPAGSAMAVGARIEAVTDGTWSTTENGANLDFYTTDGDAVQTKRMTVLADGNVGIGPTAPTKNLHVSKASGEATIRLQSAGYYSDIIQTGANLFIQNAAGGGNTIFYDDSAERMRIDTDGNVGIGDNAPGTQLQMKGTAPYVTLKNSTAEHTAGGCESKVIFEDHADVTLAQVEGSHSGTSDDTKGKMILSTHTGSALTAAVTIDDAQDVTFAADITADGSLFLKEKADAEGDTAAYGQLWVNTATPNELYFTTDAGNDIQLTHGTSTSGVSAVANGSDNRIATFSSSDALNGEANLSFDGSNLAITGTATVSGGAVQLGNGQNGSFIVADTAHDAAGKSVTLAAGNTAAGTTSNIAGGDLELRAGRGKGSGAGGDITFQVANAGSSGTTLNNHATALTISDDLSATFAGGVSVIGAEAGDAILTMHADEGDDNADQWAVSATTDGHFLIESKASGSLADQFDILGGGSAAPGGGFDRTNGVVSYVSKLGAEIVTTLHVDLHAAVAESTATEEAVIGEDGVADVYLTQLSAATNGVIYKVEMSCIETPTTGEPDIDLVGNSHELDHGVTYDSAGTETVIIAAGGDWAAGMSMQTGSRAALAALASDYLYLACGASGTNDDGVYDAGQFIIKLYGAAARS